MSSLPPSPPPSSYQQDGNQDDNDLPPEYNPPPPPSPPPTPPPPPSSTEKNRSDSVSSFHSINLNDDDDDQHQQQQQQNNLNDKNDNNIKKNGFIDLNKNLSSKELPSLSKQSKNDSDSNNNNNEKNEKEKSKEDKTESVFFFKLFKYATTLDKVFIGFGSIFAFSLGLAFPIMILLMGKITDTFITFEIFRTFASFPDQSNRTEFYEEFLIGETNATKYFELINQYYIITTHNQSSLNELPSQTGLNTEKLVEIFNNSIFQNGTLYVDQFSTDSGLFAFYMALTAIGFAILDYFALGLWEQAARNQNFQIKKLFFRSIIHQDISWFDMKSSGDFATKITNDLNLVKDGMGDKIALTIMAFSTLIFSIGIAFYYGWELTLVSMAVMPILAIAFTIIGKIQVKFASSDAESYSKAGAIAEEVINLIRTVYAFGGQQKEIERYRLAIEPAKKNGVRRSMITGISLGLMYFGIYASYGLSFWYGVNLIIRSMENHENPPKYQASTMFIVFFNVLMGAFSLGQTAPYFESIAKACGAAGSIFKIMERKPLIDSLSQEGKRIQIKGKVQFRNVHFNYPNRKEVKILNGLNLDAEPGQTIALVGSSGCGKSTIIQLIQRFYDPDSGEVLIDGINIKQLNVGQLRDQIGVVGQEPVLFDYSIKENIAMGNPEANFDDVIKAAKEANAYDFIQNLPEKFETMVGDRGGAQLSGGQKQRIATARALIRNPKILLLDEATSALDSESEKIVQAALDKASFGRTTFIVAHRLSTIRNADKIILIDQGRIKEIGTHQELIDAKGIYYNMARLQYQDQEQNQPNQQELVTENKDLIDQRKKFERTKSTDTVKSSIKGFNDNNDNKDQENSNDQSLPIKRLIKFVHPDRYLLIIATIFSFINGLTIPIYSFVFGEVLGILHLSDVDYIRGEILKYSLIFLSMGILAGLFQFFQSYLYGISSENLTFRLRNEVFRTILTQEIAYFDEPNNSTGALCARLSNDASAVQGATGSRLSVIAQTVSILTAGVILSMIYCWKLSLVMLCFVPFIIISIYYQMKILMGMSISNRKSTEQATKIAVESISNIRTVASLHLELKFLLNYINALEIDFRKSRWEPHIKSIAFGLTQMVFNMAYAIALYYGSRLIIKDELKYGELFKCTEAVLFGTNMIGQSVAFSPDYQKGKLAAVNIFKFLDRVPKILTNSIFGTKPSECNGQVKFDNVEFRYPTRPKVRVLNKISFEIGKGQTIALVGSSGCGKSTCTQILERFYDIQNGQVELDGQNIQQLNIDWLRSQMGIVSQEPMLFDKTIAENIAYGDNTRKIEMQEIVRAAEQANIHKFIKDLPNGYETSVGDKGAQLSGGQKQRLAIARALIRNPKILLLDEATSALDSESEKIVQEALDEARNGRTCLIIAHRLSTIRDVDMIFVMEKGLIAECGKHEQLLEQRGLYYQMYMAQCGANH